MQNWVKESKNLVLPKDEDAIVVDIIYIRNPQKYRSIIYVRYEETPLPDLENCTYNGKNGKEYEKSRKRFLTGSEKKKLALMKRYGFGYKH